MSRLTPLDGSNEANEANEANDAEQRFFALVEAYKAPLKRYCLKLTGSEWDADDLVQETFMKLYRSYLKKQNTSSAKLDGQELTKALLYRIASNTWIDHCRKQKSQNVVYEDETHASEQTNPLEIRTGLETLAETLPIRQVVVILLTDVFKFKAAETAELLGMKEGAVYTALHRARTKLKEKGKKREAGQESQHDSYPKSIEHVRTEEIEQFDAGLLDQFLQAFIDRSPERIFTAYGSLTAAGFTVERAVGKVQQLCFDLRDPDGNLLRICG